MSDDLVSRARGSMESFSRGDLDAALEDFSAEVVWEVHKDMAPDAGVYHGHEGVRRFWSEWRELFEGLSLEVVECEALDETRLVVVARARGVGSSSGVSLESPEFAQLIEFRSGEVVRVRLAATRGALFAQA